MFKIYPLGYKSPFQEPEFAFFSAHSAAMNLKKCFFRTLN